MQFRLATWNINSVRLRVGLIERLVAQYQPDILCLQEIKCEEAQFPLSALQELGFPHIAISGQKGYHGVATLSRLPLGEPKRRDICGRGHARHVSVEVEGPAKKLELHNVYVPAGGDIPDPVLNDKYLHKLDFLEAMEAWFSGFDETGTGRILVGDLNVAPLEADVWSHKQLLKVVSHTPAEVERFERARAAHSWVDVMRRHVPPEEKLFTWWSYRNRDWKASNRGRRLDHVWTSPSLGEAAKTLTVAQETRDWEKTSDHVPVIVDFEMD